LSYADRNFDVGLLARIRATLGQRVSGFALALVLEALLLLLLLTMSQSKDKPGGEGELVTTFDASEEPEAAPEPEPESKPEPAASPSPQPQVEPQPTPPEPQQLPPPPLIQRPSTRSFDLSQVPQAPAPPQPQQQTYGPAAPRNLARDSERVGTMPNGEPLYKAEWYVEPDKKMLGDYLSTAQGPGWGLIACKTKPEWRVVECVPLEEYPSNSHIAAAVLAAAWEFRVRPARLGGKYQYGTWVRIRIDYEIRRSLDYKPPN